MIRLRGKQNNTCRYYYEGYTYHVDKRGDSTIFRCCLRNTTSCEARVYVENFENLENCEVAGQHNHDSDPHLLLKEEFWHELETLASTTFDDLKQIYDRTKLKNKYQPILNRISYYGKYRSKMRIARAKNVPPVPRTLEGLCDILNEYPPMTPHYRGYAIGADNSRCIVFIHNSMIDPLSRCTQLYTDGTFKIRPRQPRCAQVFIIHFRKMHTGFPAIFVFTSSKTKEMYNAMWEKIFELIPVLQNNIKSITGDFEKAQIASAKEKFPNARISGCLFHYKQALAKKWEKSNIPLQYEYVLEKACAVAYLPANMIDEGFAHVTEIIDNLPNTVDENIMQKLQQFATYLRTYWKPLKNVLSVHMKPVRTNNTCENFHMYAVKEMGCRSNVFKMLGITNSIFNFFVIQSP